jgi:3-methylcrotonyl-CoA carboxylase alpha subunit
MKRLVNGIEHELTPAANGYEIKMLPDRLAIVGPDGAHTALAVRDGDTVLISYRGRQYRVEKATAARLKAHGTHSGELVSPMPGQVVDVLVSPGQEVKKGDRILVVEAMKVQQAYIAPFDGTVTELKVEKGQQIAEGQLLALVVEAQQEA